MSGFFTAGLLAWCHFGRHYQACGKWVIGGRDNQNVIALNVTFSDGGNNLGGSHTCANEGPIGFRGQIE
ncbi:hypothetical protein [Pseudomonas sp. IAC-BECa141]|uniref:hypothetical protein n=1 Tax=Pseudomonas sp. IAC-BECa141 TaxID=2793103 RepID=UPI001D09168B|nr:hypothetical protein [Pseudomonas sp. IAC-BECa141]